MDRKLHLESILINPIFYLKQAVGETACSFIVKSACTFLAFPNGNIFVNYLGMFYRSILHINFLVITYWLIVRILLNLSILGSVVIRYFLPKLLICLENLVSLLSQDVHVTFPVIARQPIGE